MAWETFTGRNKRAPKPPSVTFTRVGMISISSGILSRVPKDYRHALLMIDKDKHLMGIKFVKRGDPHAYPLIMSPRDNHAIISGQGFLKTYGIFPTETKKYPATFDEQNIVAIIELEPKVSKKEKSA